MCGESRLSPCNNVELVLTSCQRGDLASARTMPFEAIEAFEQALIYYPDHPEAMIAISNLLLDIYEEKLPAEPPEVLLPPLPTAAGAVSASPSAAQTSSSESQPVPLPTTGSATAPSPPLPTHGRKKDPTPAELNRLAARERAYMLLSALTRLGSGWDNSEAWLGLARAHELSGQAQKAKEALWWVVELEDGRGVRSWDDALGGGLTL